MAPAIVKRILGPDSCVDVPPAPMTSPLYPGQLVILPGDYRFSGYGGAWQIRVPGLYAFFNPLPESGLVAAGNYVVVGGDDTWALLRAAANLTVFGTCDDYLTPASQLNVAGWRPIALQCGQAVDFTRLLLSQPGAGGPHQTRIVRLATADLPNGWNDGHVALEAFISGKWVFVDIVYDRYWTGPDRLPLSLGEWLETPAEEQLLALRGWSHLPYLAGATTGFHSTIFSQTATLDDFTRRTFQIPGIQDPLDGLTYLYMPSGTESRQSWILGLSSSYRIISRDVWLARFYP